MPHTHFTHVACTCTLASACLLALHVCFIFICIFLQDFNKINQDTTGIIYTEKNAIRDNKVKRLLNLMRVVKDKFSLNES